MRGLLAIELLYHQIVAGNKTQTRRSGGLDEVNGRPATKEKPAIIANPDDWEIIGTGYGLVTPEQGFYNLIAMFEGGKEITPSPLVEVNFINNRTNRKIYCKPRYKVGEVLFLKEPIAIVTSEANVEPHLTYKYDLSKEELSKSILKWSNKLFMPASAARAYVHITGIRCERLLDISDEDCIAEGIEKVFNTRYWKNYIVPKPMCFKGLWIEPKDSFLSLFRFANKMSERADIGNPWVWAYTFEYLKDYRP